MSNLTGVLQETQDPNTAWEAPLLPRTYITPSTVTILATYKCNASCEHCCFDSNPYITQRLDLPTILKFIEQAAELKSVKLVVFSGGECFLLGDDLVHAVDFATQQGLKTRCVTNAYWAKNIDRGRTRLKALKAAGLNELNVSTGDYHQKWVAQRTVVNAAVLGVELEFTNTLIMVELQKERGVTAKGLFRDERLRALADGHANSFQIIESPWMPMTHDESIPQRSERLLNRSTVHLRRGCDSVLRTVVITPSKAVGLCCGLSRELIPELNVSWELQRLSELLSQAGNDFMKIWLFVDGPERILAWAAELNPDIEWENRYAHHCHVCLALFNDPVVRRTIAENYRTRTEDVLTRYTLHLRSQELAQGAVYG